MLWDQEAQWTARGAAGRTTTATLKFKPTVLSTGVVSQEPYLPKSSDGSPCYHVHLRWYDRLAGREIDAGAWVPPALDARRAALRFALNSRVFFSFILYQNERPQHLHAIGPRRRCVPPPRQLSYWDAVDVQTAMRGALVPEGAASGIVLNRLPRLDDLRRADTWRTGECWPLFPTFVWDAREFLRRSVGEARLAASTLLTTGASANRFSTRDRRQGEQREERGRRRETEEVVHTLLPKHSANWLALRRNFLPRFLVASTLFLSAWVRTASRPRDWWLDEPRRPTTPLEEFGTAGWCALRAAGARSA